MQSTTAGMIGDNLSRQSSPMPVHFIHQYSKFTSHFEDKTNNIWYSIIIDQSTIVLFVFWIDSSRQRHFGNSCPNPKDDDNWQDAHYLLLPLIGLDVGARRIRRAEEWNCRRETATTQHIPCHAMGTCLSDSHQNQIEFIAFTPSTINAFYSSSFWFLAFHRVHRATTEKCVTMKLDTRTKFTTWLEWGRDIIRVEFSSLRFVWCTKRRIKCAWQSVINDHMFVVVVVVESTCSLVAHGCALENSFRTEFGRG